MESATSTHEEMKNRQKEMMRKMKLQTENAISEKEAELASEVVEIVEEPSNNHEEHEINPKPIDTMNSTFYQETTTSMEPTELAKPMKSMEPVTQTRSVEPMKAVEVMEPTNAYPMNQTSQQYVGLMGNPREPLPSFLSDPRNQQRV